MPHTLYVGYRTGLPDVVLARWPAGITNRDYKSWICETPEELADVQRRLALPVPRQGNAINFSAGPDAALRASPRGMEPHGQIVAALYPPPSEGWPWLVLLSTPGHNPSIERGCYSWGALATEGDALDHITRLAAMAGTGAIHHILPPQRQH